MARYRRIDVGALQGRGAEPTQGTDAGAPEPSPLDTGALEAVRARRAGLRSAMGMLEHALAAPAPGRDEAWVDGVRAALATLRQVWTDHVVETEAPGGFLDELVSEAPRLANQAARLRAEHAEIMRDLVALEEALHPASDPEAVRTSLTSVLSALARHRQSGADLLYEAYDVEIGGGA